MTEINFNLMGPGHRGCGCHKKTGPQCTTGHPPMEEADPAEVIPAQPTGFNAETNLQENMADPIPLPSLPPLITHPDSELEHVHSSACDHPNHHQAAPDKDIDAYDSSKHKTLFPLEGKIKDLKVNNTVKQLLTMVSNLTPAITVSELTGAFHIDSLISSPLAISSMHLINRGTNKEHLPKLFLTALSSVGVIAAQKFATLPRIFLRPIMALAVFFIEKNGAAEHVHTKDCKHDHDKAHVHVEGHENSHGTHKERSDHKIKKGDWINLAKLQGQINTIPWLTSLYTSKLKELNEQNDSFIIRFLGNVGISASHIAGLSLGFVGLGHLIDKSLVQFKILSDKESIAMRAEGAVCACCGAPVCVAEAASEAGAMSIAA